MQNCCQYSSSALMPPIMRCDCDDGTGWGRAAGAGQKATSHHCMHVVIVTEDGIVERVKKVDQVQTILVYTDCIV